MAKKPDAEVDSQETAEQLPSGSAPLGFDEDAQDRLPPRLEQAAGNQPPGPPSGPRARQVDETQPYCPRHNVLLRATGSRAKHTNYACPVRGCDTKEKRVRPTLKVPIEPQMCPQRACKDEAGIARSALEVLPRLSNLAQLHMECPRCGFHLKVPRPQFDAAAAGRERRREAVDLSER